MFEKTINYIKFLRHLNIEQNIQKANPKYAEGQNYIIEKKIELNLANLKNIFGNSDDIIFREFEISAEKKIKAFVFFVEGLEDQDLINQNITQRLMDGHIKYQGETLNSQNIFAQIKNNLLSSSQVRDLNLFDDVLDSVLSGNTILFINGYNTAMAIGAKMLKGRPLTEPDTEVAVRGPHVGFNENLRINTSLLRKIIKNPNLSFETLVLGKQTHTDISIAYIDGIANKKVIAEVRNRLNLIDTDSILESGYVEQFIEDHPFSLFATIGNTERPDKVAAKLLEGRVAIICSGTPCVLTVPYLFIETFQANEDYYSRPYQSSILRLFRFTCFFITLTLPALYVALETFHVEMIPTNLIITMVSTREGVPFPVFLETILMVSAFELLRESGVRLPRQVGAAISIVGALIIGEAAVNAGLASASGVVIAALTGITSFLIIPLLDSVIFFRLFLILLGASFGLYGVVVGIIIMLGHMCSLKSFGVPYLSPFAPTIWKDLKDSFIRLPIWFMKSRPKAIEGKDSIRQNPNLMPTKPDSTEGEKV